ncbi:MAG: AAA family ATPase [bacterium]|nr:AAA family ATPase [bacterium]
MTQKEALDILKTGRSVFLTGAAGSGKTHVLREYIAHLQKEFIPAGITASTGIAATHMGGQTIHAWSGIGIHSNLHEDQIEAIVEKSYLKSRLSKAQVLIVDEVSMLHHFRLDLVDAVLRRAKRGQTDSAGNDMSELPFGGVQVIFCGDFFQLPPVMRPGEEQARFAYHSEAWKMLSPAVCYLHESHRQEDDRFLRVLSAIRAGEAASDDAEAIGEILTERMHAPVKGGMVVTKLYTHNKDVDAENEKELAKLPGEAAEYYMDESGREAVAALLKKGCLAPEVLRLKRGAKVMFVKNSFDKGYANGTLGEVTRCDASKITVKTFDGELIDVEPEAWKVEDNGRVLAEIKQYPIRLAWAITVHKSQGMSLDAAEIDLSKSFERGMGYVALSRVRSLEGLSIKGMNNMAMQIHEEALDIDRDFKRMSDEHAFALQEMGAARLAQMHDEFIARAGKREGGGRSKGSHGGAPKKDTVEATRELLEAGKSLAEIAAERELTVGTVLDHIEKIRAEDPNLNIHHLREAIPATRFKKIRAAFQKVGTVDGGKRPLSPVMAILGKGYNFEDLRVVRLFL